MEGRQLIAKGPGRTERTRWNRRVAATCRQTVEQRRCGTSERRAAAEVGVPRSTVRHWTQRKAKIDLSAASVEFFESPDGVELLQRIVVAVHLVFGEVGPCGTRQVATFLRLTGLDRVVGVSYGGQYKFRVQLEHAWDEFAQEERARLAPQMTSRPMSVCQDETFHPETCLVAIEPLSDFILVEQYAEQRTAEAWNACMREATEGLAVTLVQATSDEGCALLKHCREGLGAHHSPDVFHVQKDASHAFSGTTNGAVKRAETTLRHARQETQRLRAENAALGASYDKLFQGQIQLSKAEEGEAERRLEAVQARRQEVRDEVRGIGTDYHPFDLQTGTPREAAEVERALNTRFDNLQRLAGQWSLPKSCQASLAKARKNVAQMAATIVFFWHLVRLQMNAWNLSEATRQALEGTLLAACYLEGVSQRASRAEERRRLQTLSETLYARARDGPLRELSAEQQAEVERVLKVCAGLFQRSRSCVEGRNGRLALHHHGLHRLSTRKLKALTAVHNYFLRRADGTTAAERFFGVCPRDLFDWLLHRLPLPPRPGRR